MPGHWRSRSWVSVLTGKSDVDRRWQVVDEVMPRKGRRETHSTERGTKRNLGQVRIDLAVCRQVDAPRDSIDDTATLKADQVSVCNPSAQSFSVGEGFWEATNGVRHHVTNRSQV